MASNGAGDSGDRRRNAGFGQSFRGRGAGRFRGRGRGRERGNNDHHQSVLGQSRSDGSDGGQGASVTAMAEGKKRDYAFEGSKSKIIVEPTAKKKKMLCCRICQEDHFTGHCPLLSAPKPTTAFCGLGGDDLGFFLVPRIAKAKAPEVRKDSATALIKIVDGTVSSDLVKAELERMIPIKWNWIVREHGANAYLVTFPSKVELQRMVAIRRIPTDHNEGIMAFEEWDAEIKPKRLLDVVWVNVYGVPYEVRDFLSLWAIGSILGATLKVDMEYLTKTGVVRILVAVLDAKKVPASQDIVVDDSMYEIFFKVDEVVRRDDSTNPNLDADDPDEEDDLESEEHNNEDVHMDEAVNEKMDTTDTYIGNDSIQGSKQMSHGEGVPNEDEIVEAAIDIAVNNLLNEISFKVMAEEEHAVVLHEVEVMADSAPVDANSIEANDKEIASKICAAVHGKPMHANEVLSGGVLDMVNEQQQDISSEEPLHIESTRAPLEVVQQQQYMSKCDAQQQQLLSETEVRACVKDAVLCNQLQGDKLEAPLRATQANEKGREVAHFQEGEQMLRRSLRSTTASDEHTLQKTERAAARRNLEIKGCIQGNILVAVLGVAAA